jgi:hypothetical protein
VTRALLLTVILALAACGPTPAPRPSPSASPSASPSTAPAADACRQSGQTLCVLNPAVTQATIRQTICVSGWTSTVRPPVSYTDALKRQQLQQLAGQHPNDPHWTTSGTEEDHRMPLDLGGDPRAVMNLSPEEPPSENPKDRDEAALGGSQGAVCRGQMTLAQAQAALVAKWLLAWPGYRR